MLLKNWNFVLLKSNNILIKGVLFLLKTLNNSLILNTMGTNLLKFLKNVISQYFLLYQETSLCFILHEERIYIMCIFVDDVIIWKLIEICFIYDRMIIN